MSEAQAEAVDADPAGEAALRALRGASDVLQEWWADYSLHPSEWECVEWEEGRFTSLNLSGCRQLASLPAEIGQCVALTSLNLSGCEQLAWPPQSMHSAKTTELVSYFASLLALLRGKLASQDASADVAILFCAFATVEANAATVGAAVEADTSLAELTDASGRRAIDVAHKECRRKMMAALYLLGRYDVDATPPRHISATAAVVAATDHSEPDAKPPLPRRALKAMREAEQVLAELEGRNGLDPRFVVAVLAVYVDTTVADGDKEKLRAAATRLTNVVVTEVDSLSGKVGQVIAQRSGSAKAASTDASTRKRASSAADAAADAQADAQPVKRMSVGSAATQQRYTFLLVLELADRGLSEAILHDHVAGENLPLARSIAFDFANSIGHLHDKGRVHGDFKDLNGVRIGETWQLIDMDVSCEIGQAFGSKVPSSGYCPPEMAKVLLDATDSDSVVDTKRLSGYTASEAYDLWSFGVVLFHLVFGRSLWHTDQNDNVRHDDLRVLACVPNGQALTQVLNKGLRSGERRGATTDLKVAAALLRKLLEPDAAKRLGYFNNYGDDAAMQAVLEEPFFQMGAVRDEQLDSIERAAKAAAQAAKASEQAAKAAEQNTLTLISMGEEQRSELRLTRKVLLKGIFEASEVTTPTTFAVLRAQLPSEEVRAQALSLQLADDGSGFKASGEVVDLVLDRFEEGKGWWDALAKVGAGIAARDVGESLSGITAGLGRLVEAEKLYFYLVDELTGEPVRDESGVYPIEITKPAEVVPKLLPVMQVGMHAMSLFNGVAALPRMFGAPVPSIPEEWRKAAQTSVEILKQESSVEAFGAVHASAMDAGEKAETMRGAALRDLQRFFETHDKDRRYAGLRRIGDGDGAALWTALPDVEVNAALERRCQERRQEERVHDQLMQSALRRLEEGAPSAAAGGGHSGGAQEDLQAEKEKWLREKERLLQEKEAENERLLQEKEKWLREKAELEHKVQSLVSQVASVGTITDRRRARNQVALASHREHEQ